MSNEWKPPKIWLNGDCWILGGGNSLPRQFGVPEEVIQSVCEEKSLPHVYSSYMEVIHNKHVIGINDAYRIGNWIDVTFFGDTSWWLKHRRKLAKWPGIKVTCSPRFANKELKDRDGIKYCPKDHNYRIGITNNPTKVAWNNNSGAAAISLAAHFGVKRIFLLGFDMKKISNTTHWHKDRRERNQSPFKRHLKGFPKIKKDADDLGIEIYNVSINSAIVQFPKIGLEEALRL